MEKISGNISDLKKNVRDRIKKLSLRRIRDDIVVTPEFARSLCELSHELGRQLGALVDRQGHIKCLIVGDAQRILIPDLPRERSARLRGLRLIHTHLYNEPLSEEDLIDLSLLRLDYITAITFDDRGLPRKFYSAHILPGVEPGYRLMDPVNAAVDTGGFFDTIAELEELFRREDVKLKKGASRPRAILVGVYIPSKRRERSPQDSINELQELAETAGVEVVDKITQNRSRIDISTVVGSGKIKELAIRAVQKSAEIVIFDMELSPAQASRISKICDLKIIDRTQLILDIFARNARSRDGKLQVELAQLRYLKGRLSEKDDNMSRLTGGIGGRGPGETTLEIGRRRVNDKIGRLEKELDGLRNRRELNRIQRERSGIPVVSIVGYTNAGKSTLLNALTNSEVIAENRLFATLDPTTRRLRFPREKEIILSDTVGFIHDLPPELQKAFQATLEELNDSDLILHCVDASDHNRNLKISAVEKIISEMKLGDVPCIKVYNKIDLLSPEELEELSGLPENLLISAATRKNLERLMASIEQFLFQIKQN